MGCLQSFLLVNNDINDFSSVCTLEVIKLQMAAELPAAVVHSILEIVRGISYEGENVKFREKF